MTKYALEGELNLPQEWTAVGRVQRLTIFPVKSLAHVDVKSFEAGIFAAEHGQMVDRQFVVMDKKNKLATSRKYPNMSLIQPEIVDSNLILRYQGMEDITVKVPTVNSKDSVKDLDIFGDICQGYVFKIPML